MKNVPSRVDVVIIGAGPSASIAAGLLVNKGYEVLVLDKQLQGKEVDWQEDYVKPLCLGVETFRTFVDTWYDGRLQSILFSGAKSQEIKGMISSLLAGYAWDTNNPYVAESRRKVGVLAKVCKAAYSN